MVIAAKPVSQLSPQRPQDFPTEESAQTWKNIGHAAFKQKNGRLWDIGSRIGHQLRVCDWRVREISEAYRKQLSVNLKTKSFEVGKMYEDGFSWLSYLSIQSYLVDACILRDYLAEFMSDYLYRRPDDIKITAMGPFKKKVLNKVDQKDNFTQELKQATNKGGWITLLGCYRDLVVHSAPLAQAKNRLFSTCSELELRNGFRLPAICCPLPEDPASILKSRSSGSHFEDFDKQFDYSLKQREAVSLWWMAWTTLAVLLASLQNLRTLLPESHRLNPRCHILINQI